MAELVITLADLLEAEGRALRQSVMRTAVAVGCVVTIVVLGMVGIGFCVWAGYQYLLVSVGPITASLVCGLVIVFFAGILAWLTNRLIR